MKLFAFALSFMVLTAGLKAQEVDLKSQTQVQFRAGRMIVVDIYERAKIAAGNASVSVIVLQVRIADNTASCGSLAERRIRIASQNTAIDIDAKQFEEFVAAVNYLSKYQDVWEKIRVRKSKEFNYAFNVDEKKGLSDVLELSGDREGLTFSLKQRQSTLFSTRDLRVVNSFNEAINSTKKFTDSHNFNECL